MGYVDKIQKQKRNVNAQSTLVDEKEGNEGVVPLDREEDEN